MNTNRLSIFAIIACFIATFYTKSDDFCEEMYDNYALNAGTSQSKYLKDRLDKIAKGEATERQSALNDLSNIIGKKRLGICAVKFLENLSTFLNDYMQTLGEGQDADVQKARIKLALSDKIDCLIVKKELNKRLITKLPPLVCTIDNCKKTLLYLNASFSGCADMSDSNCQQGKELLLTIFLNLFWNNYYTGSKTVKDDLKNTWISICSSIGDDLARNRLKDGTIFDSRALIYNDEFLNDVSSYILKYFGNKLLPRCGNLCAYKVIDIATRRTLNCELRAQLLGLIGQAFSTRTLQNIDLESQIRLFNAFEKLTKDKCYAIQSVLIDTLLNLNLYTNREIIDIVVKKILKNVKGTSFEEIFLKEMVISGIMNVSDNISDKSIIETLSDYFEEEFSKTSGKSIKYKELLLRVLYAFNRYKYILKNEKKIFDEYISHLKLSNVKSVFTELSDSANYASTLLKIAAIYGLENFKNIFEKDAKGIIKNFDNFIILDKEKEIVILLFSIFGFTDKNFVVDYIFNKTLNNISPVMIKQYAMKYLFYSTSRTELINNNFMNKLFQSAELGCLAYLLGAFIGDKTTLAKLDDIDGCEKIKLQTDAVKELIKVAIDQDWAKKIKGNADADKITNLNLSKSDKFVTYETCGVGHTIEGASPTFLKNVIYGLELSEKGRSCDRLSFVSSVVYLMLNNLKKSVQSFYKKLDENTENAVYRGRLKNILRKIARELKVTVSLKAFKRSKYKYLLNMFSTFYLSSDSQSKKSINSYKVLLTKISERFLITFIFAKTKGGVITVKVVPFETASRLWDMKLKEITTKD